MAQEVVVLQWTVTPGGSVEDYELRQTIDGAAPTVVGTYPGSVLSAEVPIDTDHLYTWTVVAENEFGSAMSNVLSIDARQPGPPVLTGGVV